MVLDAVYASFGGEKRNGRKTCDCWRRPSPPTMQCRHRMEAAGGLQVCNGQDEGRGRGSSGPFKWATATVGDEDNEPLIETRETKKSLYTCTYEEHPFML
jgi:hypothetical protein